MKKTRADYRRELVQAAEQAAARIYYETQTGSRFPLVETVRLLREAWLAGHDAGKKETNNEN